jgi:hypothetical protein
MMVVFWRCGSVRLGRAEEKVLEEEELFEYGKGVQSPLTLLLVYTLHCRILLQS